MAKGERAQERADRGGRGNTMAEHLPGGPGAQPIAVVDPAASGQQRVDHGHRLVAHLGSAGHLAELHVAVQQLAQPQPDRQGGRQQQPGVGDQALVVKGDSDFIGVVASHLTGVLLRASNGRLRSAILAGQRDTCCRLRRANSIRHRWIRA
jgi:hypothetical protein